MTDDSNRLPEDDLPPEETDSQPPAEETPVSAAPTTPPEFNGAAANGDADDSDSESDAEDEARMAERLERLGGEPAPAISPEEFARLQKSGQIHIDSRGRIRTSRREKTDAGMSLRKRRAWYGVR